jgi:hypothetical protein
MSDDRTAVESIAEPRIISDTKQAQILHNFAANEIGKEIKFKSYFVQHYVMNEVVNNLGDSEGVLLEGDSTNDLELWTDFSLESRAARGEKIYPGIGATEQQIIEHNKNIEILLNQDTPIVLIDSPTYVTANVEFIPPNNAVIAGAIGIMTVANFSFSAYKAVKESTKMSRRGFLKASAYAGLGLGGIAAVNTITPKGFKNTLDTATTMAQNFIDKDPLDNDEVFVTFSEQLTKVRNIVQALNSSVAMNELNLNEYSIVAGSGHVGYIDEIKKGVTSLEEQISTYVERFVDHSIPYLLLKSESYEEALTHAKGLSQLFGEPKYINVEPAHERTLRSPKEILFDALDKQLLRDEVLPLEKNLIAKLMLDRVAEDVVIEAQIDAKVARLKGIDLDNNYDSPFGMESWQYDPSTDLVLEEFFQGDDFEVWNMKPIGIRKLAGKYYPILKNEAGEIVSYCRTRYKL